MTDQSSKRMAWGNRENEVFLGEGLQVGLQKGVTFFRERGYKSGFLGYG